MPKNNPDLFESGSAASKAYTAKDIEVLEGLEPVRRRPGMYIGGTDVNAMHHLAAEIIDNAMDEAVAGHASRIELELKAGNILVVRDNGRGMPIDPHPKFKNKSALEVIMTMLHAGGKFDGKAYETSGGLHGVGASVVCALSEWVEVEVARDKHAHKMRFERGHAIGKLKDLGAVNRRGTIVSFKPDIKIFGDAQFSPARLHRMAKSKAYLFRGVEIRWACDPSLIKDETPAEDTLKFPGGLLDFLKSEIGKAQTVTPRDFSGRTENKDGRGAVEWAVTWAPSRDPFTRSYCNTIPTQAGGTHEQGLRNALTKALRAHGERANNRKTALITADDVMDAGCAVLSVFIREPESRARPRTSCRRPTPSAWWKTWCGIISTIGWRKAPMTPAGFSTSSSTAPRTGSRSGRKKKPSASRPRASCACPASWRIAPRARPRAPRYSWSKATAPAAAPSRRATAPLRRSCLCAARS